MINFNSGKLTLINVLIEVNFFINLSSIHFRFSFLRSLFILFFSALLSTGFFVIFLNLFDSFYHTFSLLDLVIRSSDRSDKPWMGFVMWDADPNFSLSQFNRRSYLVKCVDSASLIFSIVKDKSSRISLSIRLFKKIVMDFDFSDLLIFQVDKRLLLICITTTINTLNMLIFVSKTTISSFKLFITATYILIIVGP